jgi:hypothetical protein
MQQYTERISLELRSLKLGLVLGAALIALSICVSSPVKDLSGIVGFVSALVAVVALTMLTQLHYKRKLMDSLDLIKKK